MQGWTSREARKELERRARLELERRRTKDPEAYKAGVIKALRSELFAQQLAVMDDPSRRISLCCSRRAGKSELAARMIAIAMLEGRRNDYVLFAARTLQRAKQIILDILKRINEQYALGWWFKDHTGEVSTPDGCVLTLLGVDDQLAMEKVRGSRYRLSICDEASTYEGYLQYLIRDCISPGTKDFSPRGRIVVCGTPGAVRKGWWFDVATGLKQGYSCHYWTLLNNPHIPDAEGALREVREDEGLDESDPVYIREYLGQWAASESELVYAYDGNRNDIRELPQPPPDMEMDEWIRQDWLTTVGADIGYNDDFSVVCLGSPPHSKQIYVLHVYKESGLLAGQQADRIKEVRDRFRPSRTVIDAGAIGKLPFEEFNARYGKQAGGVAVRAEKRNKVEAIGLLNSDLRSGTLKVFMPSCAPLTEEWRSLPWEDPITRDKEHPGFANHLCFAAGTLVQTEQGPRPIENIRPGDYVHTRFGLRKVLAGGLTGRKQTYKLESDAGLLAGTADHPVWTPTGWRRLGELSPGDKVQLWAGQARSTENQYISFGRGDNTDGTQSLRTGPVVCTGTGRAMKDAAAQFGCTERSGRACTGVYRPSTISTTKTKTLWTTLLRILSACPGPSISATTCESRGKQSRAKQTCWSTLSQQPAHGTLRQLASNFIDDLASCPGRIVSAANAPARSAAPYFSAKKGLPTCARPNVTQPCGETPAWTTKTESASSVRKSSAATSTQPRSSALGLVSRVTPTGQEENVYNLTVEGAPEYFANGVLVHNCDATLYAWRSHKAFMARPAPGKKTQEELERERDDDRNRRVRAALKNRR